MLDFEPLKGSSKGSILKNNVPTLSDTARTQKEERITPAQYIQWTTPNYTPRGDINFELGRPRGGYRSK
jgi:hypothetical protein